MPVATMEQSDAQQADPVERQPSYTTWEAADGGLPHEFTGIPDVWRVPRHAERRAEGTCDQAEKFTNLSQSPGLPSWPTDAYVLGERAEAV